MQGYNPRAFAADAPQMTLVPASSLQDTIWNTGVQHFHSNGGQFIVPASYKYTLPTEVIKELEWRVSQLTGFEAFSYVEPNSGTFRIIGLTPVATSALAKLGNTEINFVDTPLETFVQQARTKLRSDHAGKNGVSSNDRKVKDKVPRPPNAFILYRQQYHPTVLAENPHFHNNEISKFIGQQWKSEPQSVIDEWKAKALARKLEHQKLHPDYQYSPRKPGEKKQRASRKKKETSHAHPPKDYANWNHFTEMNTGMPYIDHHGIVYEALAVNPSATTAQEAIMGDTPTGSNDMHWQGNRDVGIQLPLSTNVNLQKAVRVQNFRAHHPCDPVMHMDQPYLHGFDGAPYSAPLSEDTTPNAIHNSNDFMAGCVDFDKLAFDLANSKSASPAELAILERVEGLDVHLPLSHEDSRKIVEETFGKFAGVPKASTFDDEIAKLSNRR